jgi:alkyldihydroxyacetonephosphate synthase
MVENTKKEPTFHILELLGNQIKPQKTGKYDEVVENEPGALLKTDFYSKNGWGYHDHGFVYNEKNQKVKMDGTKYELCGKYMPNFKAWVESFIHLDFDHPTPAQADMEVDPPTLNEAFIDEIGSSLGSFSRRSFNKWERAMNSHGQTLHEIWELRQGKIPKCCDMVIYPSTNEQIEKLVKAAEKHNVMLVPCGGNSNVTHSLMLDRRETRMIVCLDMIRMNKILWVDKTNMMCCAQAGIYGQDLEKQLGENFSVCCGHEPDSVEFSTLGGWISTRASGMKKNLYGNIEDIVCNIKIVTCKGTLTKTSEWPRVSSGPDLNQIIMGSEGNFGVITEVILRIRPLPTASEHNSFIFPDYETGCRFMEEVGHSRIWPASLRLVDNI